MYSSQNLHYPTQVTDHQSNYNVCETNNSHIGGDTKSNQNSPNTTNPDLSAQGNFRLQFSPYVNFRELYNEKKPFKCEICRKRFKLKAYLKKHQMAPELGKHFSCVFCSKAFPERDKLKVHERIHTGEKPFGCDLCPMTFARKDKLKNHARSHTGEKPFVCVLCLKSFTRNDKLQMHLRTHSGERPFECGICTKAFSRRDHLKKHLRIHTLNDEPNHRSRVPNRNQQSHVLSASQCNEEFKNEYISRIPPIEKPNQPCYLTPAHDLLKAISASTTIFPNQDHSSSSSSSQQPYSQGSNNLTSLRQPQPPGLPNNSMLNCSQERPQSHAQQHYTPTSMSTNDSSHTQILSQPNQNWKRYSVSSTWSSGWANPLTVPSYPIQRKTESQQPLNNIQSLMP